MTLASRISENNAKARAEKVRRKASIMESLDMIHQWKREALIVAVAQLVFLPLTNWQPLMAPILIGITVLQVREVHRIQRMQAQVAYCRRQWGL